MRRATTFLLAVIASATAAANDHPVALVGRWRSENMPVGYWAIDRYSDGRLAQKQYMRDYSDQPAEITATWGKDVRGVLRVCDLKERTSIRRKVVQNAGAADHTYAVLPSQR